jgi:hypothetical protein
MLLGADQTFRRLMYSILRTTIGCRIAPFASCGTPESGSVKDAPFLPRFVMSITETQRSSCLRS